MKHEKIKIKKLKIKKEYKERKIKIRTSTIPPSIKKNDDPKPLPPPDDGRPKRGRRRHKGPKLSQEELERIYEKILEMNDEKGESSGKKTKKMKMDELKNANQGQRRLGVRRNIRTPLTEFLVCPDVSCSYLTTVPFNFNIHIEKAHNNQPNLYECREHDCTYKCHSKANLNRHLKVNIKIF